MAFIQTLLAIVVPVVVNAACHQASPAFPPVHRILREEQFKQLRSALDSVIPDILSNPDGWTTNTTSFAVQVTSANQTLWDSYYTAPILGEYKDSEPTPVTGDTAFRIASISKSFTVYAILLENKIKLDDPITKYIPELVEQCPEGGFYPAWDQITIRSLASQLSGIAREGGLGDLAADPVRLPDPVSKGFPPVHEDDLPPCFKNTEDRPCTASELIKMANSKLKVFAINDRSTYSNVAFALLGYALERATGKAYSEILASSILQPLGMNYTRTTKPLDSMGVIPHMAHSWESDLGADIPSGGLYSTANDLTQYLQSILSSKLLPQAKTNAWMKPQSWSLGTTSAYGMPWEMLRTTKLTRDGRAIDIVTKSGDLPGYNSLIVMIPEFGLGITILVAGNPLAKSDLMERLIATLVPTAEELLRNQVRARYAGHYEGWYAGWSLTLAVDDGPGIRVLDWVSNHTDFLSVYGSLKWMGETGGSWHARLIPSEIYSPPGREESEMWRLTAVPEKPAESKVKIWDDLCIRDVDALMYAGRSVEEFVIIQEGPPWAVKQVSMIGALGGLYFKEATTLDIGEIEDSSDWKTNQKYSNDGQVPLAYT